VDAIAEAGTMPAGSASAVLYVTGAVMAAVAFVAVVFGANKLLSPKDPNKGKLEPFECGMEQAGDPHAAVRPRYAAMAVLFVIFDAETVLLFAVAPAVHGSPAALVAVLGFAAALAFGLVYAWRKGALQWRW
jgi:NADH:ubiquinone oxidoreductase subunit 3 (subunit A)